MADQDAVPPDSALERRYALRAVKQRLHQASFREAVISAYNGRVCVPRAITAGRGFGELMLYAAVILPSRSTA